jgi:hypothetical protein
VTLRFMLVNDYNTREVFELQLTELNELLGDMAIFMCMKDSIRISQDMPYGCMAFHPSEIVPGGEQAYQLLCEAITELRKTNNTERTDDPVVTAGGITFRVPLPPSGMDLRQN